MTSPSSTTTPAAPQAGGHAESYRWVVLAVAVAAQTMAALVSQGVYILVPFWQSEFHLSQASAGLAVTFMNGGQILSMLLLGMATDRYGERGVVALTMIAMGLSAFGAAAFGTSYLSLLLFLTLLGAWYASVQPGGTRAIIRWFPPNMRGFATGVRQAGLPLGTAIAAMLLPLLALTYSWQMAMVVQGAVGIVGGILFGLFHRDDYGHIATPGGPTVRQLIAQLSQNKIFWAVLLAGVAMATFQYTFSAHVLSFLSRHLQIPIVVAAFIFAVAQGVGIAGRVALAGISDRLWPGKRMRSLVWLMMLCAGVVGVLMVLPAQPPLWLMYTLFTVLGLAGIGWYPLWLLQVAEMAPKAAVASTISFAMTINLVAITLMPPVFGLVVDVASYNAAWSVLVAMLVLSAWQLSRNKPSAQQTN